LVVQLFSVYLYYQNETIMWTIEEITIVNKMRGFNNDDNNRVLQIMSDYKCSMIEAVELVLETK